MTIQAHQATLSLTEAADRLGLAPQTVRRRIRRGQLPGRLENGPRGLEYRIPAAAVTGQASLTTQDYSRADQGDQERGQARVVEARLNVDSAALNPPSHALGARAAGGCECCKVRESEVDHLRAQLDARTREMERRDQAEGELRRVLALLEQTNRELSAALVTKALPPVSNLETPARVRWWWPWRRC